jgi:hypothetical protein
MALELEAVGPLAPPSAVGAWVAALGEDLLEERARLVADIEAHRAAAITQVFPQVIADPASATAFETSPKSGVRRSRLAMPLTLGALFVAIGATAAMGTRWRRHSAAMAASAESTGSEPVAVVSAAAVVSADPAPVLPSPDPASEAQQAPPPPVPAAKPVHGPAVHRANANVPSCSPPFWFDAEGHKRYKLNCL